MGEEKQEDQNNVVDMKWMGVKRWINGAEDRTASAIILKVALVKLGHAAATSQKVAVSITDGVIGIFH